MGIGTSRTGERSERSRDLEQRAGLLPSALFSVDVDDLAGETVLTLHGELDFWTQQVFVAALANVHDSVPRIVLDLSDLTFIDAGSLGLIHRSQTLAGLRGTDLALRAPNPKVLRTLELTGLCDGAWNGNGIRPIVPEAAAAPC